MTRRSTPIRQSTETAWPTSRGSCSRMWQRGIISSSLSPCGLKEPTRLPYGPFWWRNKMQKIENFIDGKFTAAKRTLDCFEPATGKVYAQVADSAASDIEAAVSAARRAFPAWSALPAEDRARK